jgi:hypothetical protein
MISKQSEPEKMYPMMEDGASEKIPGNVRSVLVDYKIKGKLVPKGIDTYI